MKNNKTNRSKSLKELKYEVAKELGMEKEIKEKGWGGLTSRDAGKIGGHMGKRLKNKNEEKAR